MCIYLVPIISKILHIEFVNYTITVIRVWVSDNLLSMIVKHYTVFTLLWGENVFAIILTPNELVDVPLYIYIQARRQGVGGGIAPIWFRLIYFLLFGLSAQTSVMYVDDDNSPTPCIMITLPQFLSWSEKMCRSTPPPPPGWATFLGLVQCSARHFATPKLTPWRRSCLYYTRLLPVVSYSTIAAVSVYRYLWFRSRIGHITDIVLSCRPWHDVDCR